MALQARKRTHAAFLATSAVLPARLGTSAHGVRSPAFLLSSPKRPRRASKAAIQKKSTITPPRAGTRAASTEDGALPTLASGHAARACAAEARQSPPVLPAHAPPPHVLLPSASARSARSPGGMGIGLCVAALGISFGKCPGDGGGEYGADGGGAVVEVAATTVATERMLVVAMVSSVSP